MNKNIKEILIDILYDKEYIDDYYNKIYINIKDIDNFNKIILILINFNKKYDIKDNYIINYINDIFNCSDINLYYNFPEKYIIKDYLQSYSLFDFND